MLITLSSTLIEFRVKILLRFERIFAATVAEIINWPNLVPTSENSVEFQMIEFRNSPSYGFNYRNTI